MKILLLGERQSYDHLCYFVLKDLLRTLYASHLFYSSEADYKESEVIDKSKPEAVDEPDPESPVLVEPDIVDESDSEVADETELEPEVKDLIATHVDLPIEPTMNFSSSAITVPLSLKSPDVYDHLQIFLEATDS